MLYSCGKNVVKGYGEHPHEAMLRLWFQNRYIHSVDYLQCRWNTTRIKIAQYWIPHTEKGATRLWKIRDSFRTVCKNNFALGPAKQNSEKCQSIARDMLISNVYMHCGDEKKNSARFLRTMIELPVKQLACPSLSMIRVQARKSDRTDYIFKSVRASKAMKPERRDLVWNGPAREPAQNCKYVWYKLRYWNVHIQIALSYICMTYCHAQLWS